MCSSVCFLSGMSTSLFSSQSCPPRPQDSDECPSPKFPSDARKPFWASGVCVTKNYATGWLTDASQGLVSPQTDCVLVKGRDSEGPFCPPWSPDAVWSPLAASVDGRAGLMSLLPVSSLQQLILELGTQGWSGCLLDPLLGNLPECTGFFSIFLGLRLP